MKRNIKLVVFSVGVTLLGSCGFSTETSPDHLTVTGGWRHNI